MNAERLHAIANAVRNDLQTTKAIDLLQQLSKALQNQINSAQEPTHQTQVAATLKELTQALETAPSNEFPPTWKQALEELGGADLFGSALASEIREIFSRNQITPAVAQEELDAITKRLESFQESINEIRSGFKKLKIGAEELDPATAELGVLIPRDYVDNELEEFAEELEELHEIFSVFSEVATGSRPGFPIRSISSSELSVFLNVSIPVAACLAVAVERIVAFYKQLLEIRRLKNELREQNVPDESLSGIEEHANTFMEEKIGIVVDEVLSQFYKNSDDGRRHELKIELRNSLNRIANRIDNGFNIEVRVAPPEANAAEEEQNGEVKQNVDLIVNAGPTLQFLRREGRPILSLPEGEEEATKQEDESKDRAQPKKKK